MTDQEITSFCVARGWSRTGVFASTEECQTVIGWADEMAAAPVAKIHGVWLCEEAEALFKRRLDSLAKAHGLPDRGKDHYGLLATGEFVVVSARRRNDAMSAAESTTCRRCSECVGEEHHWMVILAEPHIDDEGNAGELIVPCKHCGEIATVCDECEGPVFPAGRSLCAECNADRGDFE